MRIERFFFAPARPANLAVLRIGLFGLAAVYAWQENVHGDAARAAINWRPTSFFRFLGGPPSVAVLQTIRIALIVSALCATVGLVTRLAQWVGTPLAAYLFAFDSNFGKINHRSMLLVLLLLAVLPARLGDGLSLDRLIAAGRHRKYETTEPSPAYRWPVALAQVTVVSLYFFAALSKLVNGGLHWFSAEAFQRFLYVRLDQLPNPPSAGLWLAAHPGWAQAAAIASVAFELSVVAVLFWRFAKWLVVPGLVVFHEATRILTRIDFTRTLSVAWLPLVDWEAAGARLKAREPKATLWFDGACGLCRRTAAMLRSADSLGRVALADARDGAAVRAAFPSADPDEFLEEMHLVLPGRRTLAGFDAFRRVAAMLPLTWPAVPFLWIPGVAPIGRRVYRAIAARRSVTVCGSDACVHAPGGLRPEPAGRGADAANRMNA